MLSGLSSDIINLSVCSYTKVACGEIFCLMERQKDYDVSVCVCALLPSCIEEKKKWWDNALTRSMLT